MPTMAVETTGTTDYINYHISGDAVTFSGKLDINPGLFSEQERTMTVAYAAPNSKPEFNNDKTVSPCSGCHVTGYSSNEVGWPKSNV